MASMSPVTRSLNTTTTTTSSLRPKGSVMYPSSSSSSSSSSPSSNLSTNPTGLTRYSSAPSSFLTTTIDSIISSSATTTAARNFSSLGSHPPTTQINNANHRPHGYHPNNSSTRPYCLNDIATNAAGGGVNLNSNGGGGGLVRHSSSPAGFLDHVKVSVNGTDKSDTGVGNRNGFPLTRAIGSYNSKGVSDNGHGISMLRSQLSFTREDSLSSISEERESGRRKTAHSYATDSFGMCSWDDPSGIMFSTSPGKRARNIGHDAFHCSHTAESQFQFSLSQTDQEMSTTDSRLHIPEDSVTCRIRAKRGFATHPRSIAERDRRTRINGKLKKLQDIVPNLDKGQQQTSYADMLDLAVQHIKGLQNQVQKLKEEVENCTCRCKQTK